MKAALKKLNDSHNILVEHLNELQIHWDYFKENDASFLKFYGMTKDPDKYQEKEEFGYKGKEIKAAFDEADKEIPNISTSYEKNPDAIYNNCQDSQLLDLEVSSSLQSREIVDDENSS
ncbi:unnamed protein product [Rhizophagus irregularis]|nr:unnamed protein product [Rhizophagus irregularis]